MLGEARSHDTDILLAFCLLAACLLLAYYYARMYLSGLSS